MAYSERLTNWLLENADNLNLYLTQLTWPQDWGLHNIFDLEISIEIGEQKYIGRGTALTESDAIIKAGAEAIERAFVFGNRIHSTGVALHTDEMEARTNATLELNERAAFFGHFYSNTPFLRLTKDECASIQNQYSSIITKLKMRGVTLSFFKTSNRNGLPAYVCSTTGLNSASVWGGAIGLSCKTNSTQALSAAFFECLRTVVAYYTLNEMATLSQSEFLAIQNPTSFDRQKLARNVTYWRSIEHLFPSELNPVESTRIVTETFTHSTQRLECPFDILTSAPVIVYRAKPSKENDNNSLNEKLNSKTVEWLSDFFGKPMMHDLVQQRPHFLG